MQPKWLVIAGGRELGEFASRYAAMIFAERLPGSEGPYAVREKLSPSLQMKATTRSRSRRKSPSQSVKTVLV